MAKDTDNLHTILQILVTMNEPIYSDTVARYADIPETECLSLLQALQWDGSVRPVGIMSRRGQMAYEITHAGRLKLHTEHFLNIHKPVGPVSNTTFNHSTVNTSTVNDSSIKDYSTNKNIVKDNTFGDDASIANNVKQKTVAKEQKDGFWKTWGIPIIIGLILVVAGLAIEYKWFVPKQENPQLQKDLNDSTLRNMKV